MAVCPKCNAGVGLNAERCPNCGASIQIVPEPQHDPIQALKADIQAFVQEKAPEDAAAAARQIEGWRPTAGDGPVEVVSTAEEAMPIAVYNAPDETSARLVASLLEADGIDAVVDQHTVPMLETAQSMREGIWGCVLVHRKDAERATEILGAYESSEDNLAGTDAPPPASS